MRQKLITAIDIVIRNIENDTIKYDWDEYGSCNMGLVAQALLGKTADSLDAAIGRTIDNFETNNESFDWSKLVIKFCPMTGLSKHKIFKALQESGLSREDMMHLEYLSDPKVLSKIKSLGKKLEKTHYGFLSLQSKDNYESVKSLLEYLKAWRQILLEEGDEKNSSKPIKQLTASVSVN
jgi:hypothetical protein